MAAEIKITQCQEANEKDLSIIYEVFLDPSFSLVPNTCLSQCALCSACHISLKFTLTSLTATPQKSPARRTSRGNTRINAFRPAWSEPAPLLRVLRALTPVCAVGVVITPFLQEKHLRHSWTQGHISAKARLCLPSTLTSGMASSSQSTRSTQRPAAPNVTRVA